MFVKGSEDGLQFISDISSFVRKEVGGRRRSEGASVRKTIEREVLQFV